MTVVTAAVVVVLADAPPAAAHIGGGELPVPSWLLAYLGAAAVLLAALAVRARLAGSRGGQEPQGREPSGRAAAAARLIGLATLVAVVVVAATGDDQAAANVAPWAVLVVWWVGLPLLCLVAGDVMARVNPFSALVGATDRLTRRTGPDGRSLPPSVRWTPAAFLAAFIWYLVAYHQPGSPRSLAVLLGLYTAAAVAGGLRWGPTWLREGEAFAVLSAGVASVGLRRHTGARPAGLGPLVVVWLGGSLFDAVATTAWWWDILGTSTGWSRTGLQTLGLAWSTALVASAVLGTAALAERLGRSERSGLRGPVAIAALPLTIGWFAGHELVRLLFEGQNFLILVSDPLGRGWDLFGTRGWFLEPWALDATWVTWTQAAALVGGHVGSVALTAEVGRRRYGRRSTATLLWAVTGLGTASVLVAFLLW